MKVGGSIAIIEINRSTNKAEQIETTLSLDRLSWAVTRPRIPGIRRFPFCKLPLNLEGKPIVQFAVSISYLSEFHPDAGIVSVPAVKCDCIFF
jgi:hypothetical protein